ncbi:MAG TPA: CHASE2 domain-containing protein, partial [Candidatus Ozemobacteraceae bacterium]|nr:CHASE2 domain-containing protein [Candidatus Ozemobacteraceae bacterium]
MLLKRIWFGLILAIIIFINPWTRDLERWSVDERFQWRGVRSPLADLIIVKIDAPTLQWANTPFWGFKPLYEEFLTAMCSVQARAVFLDLIFDVSPDPIIQQLVGKFCEANQIAFPPHLLNRLGFDLPFRQALVKARQAGVKVILGYNKEQQGMAATHDLIHLTTPEDQKGFLNMLTDSDHVIRRALVTAVETQTERWYPSVARVMAWQIASECVLPPSPEILINYAGPAGTYQTESFMNVLNTFRQKPNSLERFRGKTVLLGLGDITDLKAVPWKGFMNGVEIHANIVENLVRANWLRRAPPWVSPVFMLLVFPLQILLFQRRGWIGGLVTLVISVVWVASAQVLFAQQVACIRQRETGQRVGRRKGQYCRLLAGGDDQAQPL